MQIVSKISPKSVCGELKGTLENLGKQELDVMRVIGITKKKEAFTGQFGVSWRLQGEFKALNLTTKEEYYSPECFLPGLAESLITNQMDDAGENAIQFAFIIGIKAADNKVGYEFTVKPLIKPAENSALAMIEKNLLPAPGDSNAV